MRAVHIGICHDDDLVIAQFCDVKIISVPFGKTASEGVDHRFDLRVCQDLVDRCFFDIQDLAAYGQDRLVVPVSCGLGRTAGRVSLNDKNLALFGVSAFTVGEFSVAVKGKLLFYQQVCPGLLLGLPDFCGSFRAAEDGFQAVQVLVEIPDDLLRCHLRDCFGSILVVKLCLCLSLKAGIGMTDRDDCRNTVADIRAGKVHILFLQDAELPGVRIHHLCEGGLEACQMRSAFRIIDIVAEPQHRLVEFVHILKRHLHGDMSFRLSLKIDRFTDRFLVLVQVPDITDDPIRFMESNLFRFLSPLIPEKNGQGRIQIRRLMQPAFYLGG